MAIFRGSVFPQHYMVQLQLEKQSSCLMPPICIQTRDDYGYLKKFWIGKKIFLIVCILQFFNQEMIERLKVTSCTVYPNIVRDLMKYKDDWPQKYDLSSLMGLGVGMYFL